MTHFLASLVMLCLVLGTSSVAMSKPALPQKALPQKASKGSCLGCHKKSSRRQVAIWSQSAHAKKGVGCAACHGTDHAKMVAGKAKVRATTCGRCHKKALRQHKRSRHGMGLHSGWGCTRQMKKREAAECRFCHDKSSAKPLSTVQCARFLKQSTAMAQVGCNRCHQIERSCAACHSNHATARKIVRSPSVCAKCHMGPDHPQWEMWKTSKHGTLYRTMGAKHGPTCQSCHLPKGGHDVSHGLTMSPSGKIYGKKRFAAERKKMLRVCTRCHATRVAKRELSRGDRVRRQSRRLVARAKKIIEELHARKLLDPMPKNRAPHPQRGKTLVLDGQILYEGTSHIERLYFRMKKFYLAQTVKGAYHQNAAWTHWYGNARLKMALIDIRAEASRLERAGRRQKNGTATGQLELATPSAIENRLKALLRAKRRGEISDGNYRKRRVKLLREFLEGSKKRR